MMEAVQTSETMVNLYQSTWRYNPEDSHLIHVKRIYMFDEEYFNKTAKEYKQSKAEQYQVYSLYKNNFISTSIFMHCKFNYVTHNNILEFSQEYHS
jgi:hypothetical protein